MSVRARCWRVSQVRTRLSSSSSRVRSRAAAAGSAAARAQADCHGESCGDLGDLALGGAGGGRHAERACYLGVQPRHQRRPFAAAAGAFEEEPKRVGDAPRRFHLAGGHGPLDGPPRDRFGAGHDRQRHAGVRRADELVELGGERADDGDEALVDVGSDRRLTATATPSARQTVPRRTDVELR